MIRSIGISLITIVLLITGCSSAATSPTPADLVIGEKVVVDGWSYTDVSVAELQTMLENKDFSFINVHIPFEGDIANTDLSIPYDEISQNLDRFPGKNDKIVLYCRSGRMSDIAARELVSLGYTSIWNLSGGMVAWEQAGLDIER